tara:strand:+ start:1480 stop:1734 length:255 start_codon:yes stop_codon:yes gene_type:complete
MKRKNIPVFYIPYETWYTFFGFRFFVRKYITEVRSYTEQQALWIAKNKIRNTSNFRRLEFKRPIIDIEFIALVTKIRKRRKLCQ